MESLDWPYPGRCRRCKGYTRLRLMKICQFLCFSPRPTDMLSYRRRQSSSALGRVKCARIGARVSRRYRDSSDGNRRVQELASLNLVRTDVHLSFYTQELNHSLLLSGGLELLGLQSAAMLV